jgi:hypothetical protein
VDCLQYWVLRSQILVVPIEPNSLAKPYPLRLIYPRIHNSEMLLRSKRSTTKLRSVKASVLETLLPREASKHQPTSTVHDVQSAVVAIKSTNGPPANEPLMNGQRNEENFWQTRLAGTAGTLFPRLPYPSFEPIPQSLMPGASCGMDEPSIPQAQIAGFICAAWALVLSYHTESQESVFGLRFSTTKISLNGTRPSILPMRVLVDHRRTISTFLKDVSSWSEHIKSSKLNLDHVRSLSPDANTACSFQTVVDFHTNQSISSESTAKAPQSRSEIAQRLSPPKYAIVLECAPNGQELLMSARFDERLVTRTAMRLLMSELEHMVWQMLRPCNIGQTLESLESMSPAGRRQVVRYNRP